VGRVSGATAPQERLRELAATATVGTDRFGGDDKAAAALLGDAARYGLQARAGWRPQSHPGRLPDCPPDDRPFAPKAAHTSLARLLAEPDATLIEEWAQLARAHGVVVDGATAPLVLDWWARQPRRSEDVFAALGRRGEWLASLNADWQKPVATVDVPADAEGIWQTGKGAERLAVLTSVRRHDPARALALVASTWLTDGAADRQRFLEILTENRSMADEPFLEAALDDRSKVVRRQAAAVLALIPDSRLRQRLSETARTFITVRTPRGMPLGSRRRQIVLVPPDTFAAEWERDGIEQRPPEGVGPRAWWVRQILSRVGLGVWGECTGLDPQAILEALKGDDYAGDAVQALIAAAVTTTDASWITALIGWLLGQTPIDLDVVATLLQGLPDAERESLSLQIAAHARLTSIDKWNLLTSFERPWSIEFSIEAMKMLGRHASTSTEDVWRLARAIEAASRRIAPAAVDAFEQAVAHSLPEGRVEAAMRSVERARLRAEMHKEFAQ
jgi:hypothetical protein